MKHKSAGIQPDLFKQDEPRLARSESRGLLTRAAGRRPPIRASIHHRPVERCGGDGGELLAIGGYVSRSTFRASREAQDIEIYIPYAGIGCLGTFA